MERPELLARLRGDFSLIPRFVEEVLRLEPSVHGIARVTTQEVTVAGVTLPKGARVLLLLGSANHDEARFPRGDEFLLEREGVNNLPFGHGIHFCLGAPLARLEARLGLEALLTRFRGFSPAGPVGWNVSLTVRGPTVLPVVAHCA
jgi:cytochrome P450